MFLWILTLCVMGAGCLGCVFYLVTRIRRFSALQKLEKKRSWLVSAALFAIPVVVLAIPWGALNMAVCLLHLALFWMLADLAFALVRRLRKKKFKRYWAGGDGNHPVYRVARHGLVQREPCLADELYY